jgi:hypothetical protein
MSGIAPFSPPGTAIAIKLFKQKSNHFSNNPKKEGLK